MKKQNVVDGYSDVAAYGRSLKVLESVKTLDQLKTAVRYLDRLWGVWFAMSRDLYKPKRGVFACDIQTKIVERFQNFVDEAKNEKENN